MTSHREHDDGNTKQTPFKQQLNNDTLNCWNILASSSSNSPSSLLRHPSARDAMEMSSRGNHQQKQQHDRHGHSQIDRSNKRQSLHTLAHSNPNSNTKLPSLLVFPLIIMTLSTAFSSTSCVTSFTAPAPIRHKATSSFPSERQHAASPGTTRPNASSPSSLLFSPNNFHLYNTKKQKNQLMINANTYNGIGRGQTHAFLTSALNSKSNHDDNGEDYSYNDNDDYDDNDNEDDEEDESPLLNMELNGYTTSLLDDDNELDDMFPSREELQSMTVTHLKQQLRLRGKKVSGNKGDLVERLLDRRRTSFIGGAGSATSSSRKKKNMEDGGVGIDGVNGSEGSGSSSTTTTTTTYSKYQKPFRSAPSVDVEEDCNNNSNSNTHKSDSKGKEPSKKVKDAKERGADIVDVTRFVDAEDAGKAFRSSDRKRGNSQQVIVDVETTESTTTDTTASKISSNDDEESNDETSPASSSSESSPEVWGEDARIVDDYEGRSIVVDGLSRTIIEYTGCNGTTVQAYVVASRESLKKFMSGGTAGRALEKNRTKSPVYSSVEEEVYAIQRKRELQSKRGLLRPEEADGSEDAQDPGTYYNVIERDFGDWGVFTPTGAQLSSSEVQGVLLLSDVHGPFTDDMQALADKIAFECQPVVVLVPDLFRGNPWERKDLGDDGVERNEKGETYEDWRASHPDRRVDVDIRAAAAVLRERYAVSSIAVWGTCYGGGRALEAAAGWYPDGVNSYFEDAYSERPPPPHVDPIACIAWYPTRYDAKKLFGPMSEGFSTFENGKDRSVAVMAIFAENDSLPGATEEDALLLKSCLDDDRRIKDAMVKVFPDQKHGFAHASLGAERRAQSSGSNFSQDDGVLDERFLGEDFGTMAQLDLGGGDAEVACLLSTAWMETYTRVFLPTVGSPVQYDEDETWSTVEMKHYSQSEQREIRKELEEAIANYEDVDIDFRRMPQSRSPLLDDGEGVKVFDKIEEEREQMRQKILEQYSISPDDDEETFDQKVRQAYEDGALKELLLDAYMDDAGDAYW